jgi:tetrahydromethanopterin S-methyltransferase subunit E
VSEQLANMHIQGVSNSFLFGIGWTLAPLVAVALVGILGIARFAFAPSLLALLYLIACLLGGVVLGLTLFATVYGLQFGALGEAIGYALCFWADRLWRGKRRAVNIWNPPA